MRETFKDRRIEKKYFREMKLKEENTLESEKTQETFYKDKSGAWCSLPFDVSGEYDKVHPEFAQKLDKVREKQLVQRRLAQKQKFTLIK